jgi:Fe-S cluster biogenesis protein NfuA
MEEQERLIKLHQALEEIRPFLQKDGGDISLIDYNNNEVTIQFEGNCSNCKINNLTLNIGVKQIIKKHLPEIEVVKSIE